MTTFSILRILHTRLLQHILILPQVERPRVQLLSLQVVVLQNLVHVHARLHLRLPRGNLLHLLQLRLQSRQLRQILRLTPWVAPRPDSLPSLPPRVSRGYSPPRRHLTVTAGLSLPWAGVRPMRDSLRRITSPHSADDSREISSSYGSPASRGTSLGANTHVTSSSAGSFSPPSQAPAGKLCRKSFTKPVWNCARSSVEAVPAGVWRSRSNTVP